MSPKISPLFRHSVVCLAAGALLGVSTHTLAAEFYGDAYGFSASGAPNGATSMRVTGPRGFAVESESLNYSGEQRLPNGSYKYEIYGTVSRTDSAVDVKRKMDQGRKDSARPGKATGVLESGHFRMVNGEVHIPRNEAEEESSGD